MRTFQHQKEQSELRSHTMIQPQLEIGKEDDEQEKEANTVADKVMKMPDNSGKLRMMSDGIEKPKMRDEPPINMMKDTPVRKMSDGKGGAIVASPKVEQGISNSKGSGHALPAKTQQELGGKMNADFSGVNIHTDSNAIQMNKEIGAKAFTHGNDIYFNSGQYNPASDQGKHLLAHELTHTVQQGNSIKPKVQRKILVGGKEHAYSEEFAKELTSLGLQIYNTMIKSVTEYTFTDETVLKNHINTEEKFRNALIEVAKKDDETCNFGMSVKTNSPSWEPVEAYPDKDDKTKSMNYAIGLTGDQNVLPSDAVKAIFNPDNGSTFDCSAMMMSNVYNAMLIAVGPDAFNKLYEGDKRKDLKISPEFVYFKDEKSGEFKDHPLLESGMYEKTNITSMNDLIPGDWVYFQNSLIYTLIIGASGAWMGEHAVFTGMEGEDRMFKGFGITSPVSYAKMIDELNAASFRAMNHSDIAVWKAVEQWAPKPEDRVGMFLALAQQRLTRYLPIEKQADGYKVTPDGFAKRVISDAYKIDIGPVIVSLKEYDPDNNIYTEPDMAGTSLTGQLPSIQKEGVLRPRIDKMK